MPQGLPRRIRVAFVRQALLSCVAIVVSVCAVALIGRNLLVREWLHVEAQAFWQAHDADPAHAAPDTGVLRGWFVPADGDPGTVPAALRDLPDGITHLRREGGSALLSRRPQGSLYLSLSTVHVDRMVALASTTLILLGLLAAVTISWLTYRKSRRMVLPINRLAEEVSRWSPAGGDIAAPIVLPVDSSREVRALSSALQGLAGRVAEYIQRERDFTRDASHELRTPLTVVRVATDMMLGDPSTPAHTQRSLQRIQRASRDMEAVIDAFLILAREHGIAPVSEEFEVREVVADEIAKARPLLEGKPVELRVVESASPRLLAPPRVFGVMIGNLLRNACLFTERGSVEVEVGADAVVVRDTGIGMSAEVLRHAHDPFYRADQFSPVGKGFGLSIVHRLGNRFGWPVTLDSEPGRGTTATIRFAAASLS